MSPLPQLLVLGDGKGGAAPSSTAALARIDHLSTNGFEVRTTADVTLAARWLEQGWGRIILLDRRLFPGEQALVLFETLRERWPHVRRVILSDIEGLQPLRPLLNHRLATRLLLGQPCAPQELLKGGARRGRTDQPANTRRRAEATLLEGSPRGDGTLSTSCYRWNG